MTTFGRRGFIKRGAALGAAVLAAPNLARAAGPIEMKLAHGDTVTHPEHHVALHFADLVGQRTQGRVKIRVYAGGQLGSETNIVSGLQTGIVDFTQQTTGFLEQFFPRIAVLDLPFLFKDDASAEHVVDGPIGDDLLHDMLTKDIYGLNWGCYGWRETETRSQVVHEPADLKGLKIRIQPAPVFAAMFKAVGAVPVALDITEVYVALSQNTVQGLEVPFLTVASTKVYEVVKHVGLTNHVYNAGCLMASKAKFDTLTPGDQTIIRQTAKEMTPYWRKLMADSTVGMQKLCEDHGVAVNEIDYDAFHKAMQPVYTEFRDKIGADIVDRVLKATGA